MKKFPSKQLAILRSIDRLFPTGKTFLVGGSVRDLLLGRAVKDCDVVVTGVRPRMVQKKLATLGKVEFVGARFGVFKVFPKGGRFHLDVALPRRETAHMTGGLRDFAVQSDPNLSIEDDLSRRDFTVNAMAYNMRTNELIDPFGGLRDLKKKMLRAVGAPELRFKEDYSRMLRLLRFACQLDFAIEPKTAVAAKKLMPRLMKKNDGVYAVPREVVAEQLLKALAANPVAAFDLLDRFGVFRVLLPEVEKLKGCTQSKEFHSEKDVFVHTRMLLVEFGSSAWRKEFGETEAPLVVVLAALFHDLGKPATRQVMTVRGKRMIRFMNHTQESVRLAADIAERLKLSSYNGLVPTDRLLTLIRNHHMGDPATAKHMKPATVAKYFAGEEGAQLLQLIWADQRASLRRSGKPDLTAYRLVKRRVRAVLLSEQGTYVAPKPLVSGTDLMRWFKLAEGPFLGGVLKSIAARQLEKKVTTKTQAKAYATSLLTHNRGKERARRR